MQVAPAHFTQSAGLCNWLHALEAALICSPRIPTQWPRGLGLLIFDKEHGLFGRLTWGIGQVPDTEGSSLRGVSGCQLYCRHPCNDRVSHWVESYLSNETMNELLKCTPRLEMHLTGDRSLVLTSWGLPLLIFSLIQFKFKYVEPVPGMLWGLSHVSVATAL